MSQLPPRVRVGRSAIHNWGLFARVPLQPHDLVIEYVGETIRQRVADLREQVLCFFFACWFVADLREQVLCFFACWLFLLVLVCVV